MATLVIEDIPDELHDRLVQLAKLHQRSLSQEAIALLEPAVASIPAERPPKAPTPYKLKGKPLTIRDIESAIRSGRE